ncbi:MAG TPA: hypothetical protein VFE35_06230 [Candidatus Cybelea sp.]|nr:hypothetical protein [Candidatus Cybelea sp.]
MTEYASGKTSLLRTISQGISNPVALVFGSDGYLFVANDANSTVTEYAPGKNVVVRTISQGVNAPFDLAFGP